MSEFSISNLPQGAIQYLHALRNTIWLDPPYQRMSDIWPLDKRQLLIDSVINGFDIPKLYFHELVPARKDNDGFLKYAIIDGKQRLESLWGFMDGKFALADDFEYLHDDRIKLAGLTYKDIGEKFPLIKSRFDGTSLTVVAVRTDDIELIDEMFSRLNEAVPLNAPEKRNAFGGPLPKVIRDLAENQFFKQKLPVSDRRFKHRDLATKFLLIESRDAITDTKKAYLDRFVKAWAEIQDHDKKQDAENQARILESKVKSHLDRMTSIFVNEDDLLRSLGMTLVIFHFFRLLHQTGLFSKIRREHFDAFDAAREKNRAAAEEDLGTADYSLLEFDKYVQTPNDAYATRLRLGILVKFMRENASIEIPEDHVYLKDPRMLLSSGT